MPLTSDFQLHYCFVECSHFVWWHGRIHKSGDFQVCLSGYISHKNKHQSPFFRLRNMLNRQADELCCSASSHFFTSHLSFCLLYFDPQVLRKHAWFFFKDSNKVHEFVQFLFSSTVSVIAFQSRSSSPRFLYSVMLFATVLMYHLCQECRFSAFFGKWNSTSSQQ